jgi:two-component system response regulator
MIANRTDILLVEDDPMDVQLMLRELAREGKPRIEVVRDGEEALDFLFCRGAFVDRSLNNPPKLILLDLKLPKVSGLQVLLEIKAKAETRAIPVITLTSSREEKDLVESYRLGVNSYIQKPVDFENFRETIQALKNYWMVINQPPPQKSFASGENDADKIPGPVGSSR